MNKEGRLPSWKNIMTSTLKTLYGGAYEAFLAEDPHDARRLYINVYNIILDALNTLPEEPDNYVCVAMDAKIDEDLRMMRAIGRLAGRTDYIFTIKEIEEEGE